MIKKRKCDIQATPATNASSMLDETEIKNAVVIKGQTCIPLTHRKTGETQLFAIYKDSQLRFMTSEQDKAKPVQKFDMSKLELEYDYETDEEQVYRARKLL